MQWLRMPCRGYQFDPWSGKIPHAAEQLSPGATLLIPCSRASALQQRSHHSEKPAQDSQTQLPLAATRESPHAATKTQCSQKVTKKIKKKKFIKKERKPSSFRRQILYKDAKLRRIYNKNFIFKPLTSHSTQSPLAFARLQLNVCVFTDTHAFLG